MDYEATETNITPVIEPPPRGSSLLRPLEGFLLQFDRGLGRILPEKLNPFLQTGTIAVAMLFVAIVTGVILLIWYKPSVHMAYASVEAMNAAPWTAGLLRSLHRYSSDACVLFGALHVLRLISARRFTGPRWFAWITGVATMALLWFVGWTGYWLVWDERGQHVATGSAKMLDVLPIFIDPMQRSFLTDEGVNSLLFFVVFFIHMMVPLLLGLFLWLHIVRIARSKYLTDKPMALWSLGTLLLLSIAYPATSAGPAKMTALAQSFSMDWWYLAPIPFTDRFSAAGLWLTLIGVTALFGGIPWLLARGKPRTAAIDAVRCNACEQCFNDCPYDAISMVPRTDGNRKFDLQAAVNPGKCVGCGICAGSCNSLGAGLPWYSVSDQRKRLEEWLGKAVTNGEEPSVAFICSESVGAALSIDPHTGRCKELPEYLVQSVPCAGWVHALSVELALRQGARRVLIASCPGEAHFREGGKWLHLRFDGARTPSLRTEKVERERVAIMAFDKTQTSPFIEAASAWHEGGQAPPGRAIPKPIAVIAASLIALLVAGATGVISDLGYTAPAIQGSELVVTFKHPGVISENCREFSPEELAKLPIQERQQRVCDRERSAVRLQVAIDGKSVREARFAPKGLWGDGPSIAMERIALAPGEHEIQVALGDSPETDLWQYHTSARVAFEENTRRVLSFDRIEGFSWH